MLDKLEEYHLHFEDSEDGSKILKRKKQKDKKDLEMIEEKEIEDDAGKRENEPKENKGGDEALDQEKKGEAEEEKFFINEKKEDSIEDKFFPDLMKGLKGIDIRICPLSEDVEKMATKKKFQGLFDVIASGFLQSAVLFKNDEVKKILVPDTGIIYQENA